MPYLETPDELADYLADRLGIYGSHVEDEAEECRICFTMAMAHRIRAAVENENQLARPAITQPPKGGTNRAD